ncbi:MlaD superfamily [Candidatus Gastranaerophilus sp. (ex Termes propinquus)]|nr:MlaD superfamily [Candidatus Gastranaerophilus sp. (ex Termes propinquus)]
MFFVVLCGFVLQNYYITSKYTYTLPFHDIDGVIKGSPVRFMGTVVGHVKNIKVQDDELLVQMIITRPGLKIPDGTTAKVEFTGLAGSKSIEMMPPQTDAPEGLGVIVENPLRLNDFLDSLKVFDDMLLGVENMFLKLASKESVELIEKIATPRDFSRINQELDSIDKLQNNTRAALLKMEKLERGIKMLSNMLPKANK